MTVFRPLLLIALLGTASLHAWAQPEPRYFTPGRVDGVALLAPPPEPGSAEEKADLDSARTICKSRTPAEEAAALESARLSMFLFAPAFGPGFEPGKFPKTEALFATVKKEIGGAVDDPKQEWKRKRPYELDPELAVAKPERSFSYPSGHSTRGTVYALVFAEVLPEEREAILAVGRRIGWDRIILGKHYPTDVFAGRVLGKAIFRELKSGPEFQEDIQAARAEILELRKQNGVAETK